MYTIMDGQQKVTIDPDGSGPLKPFNVICNGKSKSVFHILKNTYIWGSLYFGTQGEKGQNKNSPKKLILKAPRKKFI